MPIRVDSSRSLPFVDAFPERDRKATEAAFARHDAGSRATFEARERVASKLVADFRSRTQALLGAKKVAVLRDAMARERLAFRDLWQPPIAEGRDYDRQDAARRRRVDAVLRKLGGDAAKLRAQGLAFDEQSRALATSGKAIAVPGYAMGANRDRWTNLSPHNRLPLPWGVVPVDDPDDPHRWFVFQPPFFGFNYQFACTTTEGYVADRVHVVDPPAGLVGYEATLKGNDENEYEFGALGVFSAIAFAFQAPVPGLVEILVDGQCALGHHHVKMVDHWGWSGSTTLQQNSLTMDVLHPNTPESIQALMSDFRTDFDGDSVTVDREFLVPGQHYFAQGVTRGSVPGGAFVVVQIGTFGADTSKLDDLRVESSSQFRWFISSVQVRIAP